MPLDLTTGCQRLPSGSSRRLNSESRYGGFSNAIHASQRQFAAESDPWSGTISSITDEEVANVYVRGRSVHGRGAGLLKVKH